METDNVDKTIYIEHTTMGMCILWFLV